MLINLCKPVPHITIALFFRTVIAEHDAICSFVISLSDGSEAFLACSVPNLEFDIFAVYRDVLNLKINSYTCVRSDFIEDLLPMVAICELVNVSSANLSRSEVFPTSESPIRMSLIR